MKHLWKVLIAMAVMLALVVVPATATANDYDSSLPLENKNWSDTWDAITEDDISGTLNFNSSGAEFEFNLTATGLANGNYSLIYYADKPVRFDNWGGNNPGKVIWQGVSSEGILASNDISVDLDMNLPSLPDANIYEHCYCEGEGCTGDNYQTCHGAKLWLIPTSALTAGNLPVQAWPPDNNWLFETNLILYDDTDITNESEVALTTDVQQDLLCISVSPNTVGFGSLLPGICSVDTANLLTITNCGSVPITVTTLVSGSLYIAGLELFDTSLGWKPASEYTTTIPAWGSGIVYARVCVPVPFPAGIATGSLSFIATVQP